MSRRALLACVLGVAGPVVAAFGGEAQISQAQAQAPAPEAIPNRLIDYPAFLANAKEVDALRSAHRVTEAEFLQMSREPGTLVLDARSDDKYRLLHIQGAKHLSLTDVTAETLAATIPTKDTRVLIYCNNNFLNAPRAFAAKSPAASLNLYTFNTLYSYGYRNVYELGPLIDIRSTQLPFEGSDAAEIHPAKP